jgi:hypothetical protein
MREALLLLAALSLGVVPAGGAGEGVRGILSQAVLTDTDAGGVPSLAVYRALSNRVAEAEGKIRGAERGIADAAGLAAWQDRVRAECLRALGPFPERTPLDARVTGTVSKSGYSVDKVLFESRPRFYVTALVFRPDPGKFAPPYPAVLIPCGHSNNGKADSGYQRGARIAAANGILAMVYDPIDQGERIQRKGSPGNCAGHNTTGVAAALVGLSTAGFRVWDGMRALDYLASRPDVDPGRLGCMGNSGGGTLTAYISALDPRVKVSAPSCFISSVRKVYDSIGPQDAEQNIFGQLAFGLDHSGWLLLRAPKPTLVCLEKKDFFPFEGATDTVARVSGIYARLGRADAIASAVNDGPHGWAEPLRVASVKWMVRWLIGAGAPFAVPPIGEPVLTDAEALVTPTGSVLDLRGAQSVYDIIAREARRLAPGRGPKPAAEVRSALGIAELAKLPVPFTRKGPARQIPSCRCEAVVLTAPGRVPLPGWLFTPDAVTGAKPLLVADGEGKEAAAEQVSRGLDAGRAVLAVDLSAVGETCGSPHKFYGAPNKDEELAVMAYALGGSLVRIRAEDVLIAARWLGTACGSDSVEVCGSGWAATPVRFAAICEPKLLPAVSYGASQVPSWTEVAEKGIRHRFSDVVNCGLVW